MDGPTRAYRDVLVGVFWEACSRLRHHHSQAATTRYHAPSFEIGPPRFSFELVGTSV